LELRHLGCGLASKAQAAANSPLRKGEATMLYWALVFLIVALVAAALGFGGIAGASAGIAKILFFIFLVLLLVSLVTHFMRGSRIPWGGFRMARKYSPSASKDVEREMHKFKRGKLKSGKGGKGGSVKSRKQAIAIGLSEARKKGKKVPKKKAS
jgi:uncharacterized membrane protein YtjA (UPF0391 family)